MVRLCSHALVLLALLVLTACRAGGNGSAAASAGAAALQPGALDSTAWTERDSAGVRIVLNTRPASRSRVEVAAAPRTRIGELDGAPEYLLDRVVFAVRLGNGDIVVANNGSSQLRFYDGRGRFLRSAGRRGAGPGEFRDLLELGVKAGDTVFASDQGQRINVFSPDGRFLRSIPASRPEHPFFVLYGVLPDGRMFGSDGAMRSSGTPGDVIMRFAALAENGTSESLGARVVGRNSALQGRSMHIVFSPLGRTTQRDSVICFGSGEYFSIECSRPGEEARLMVRREQPARPVTQQMVQAFRAAYTGGGGEGGTPANPRLRQLRESNLQVTEFASTLPAHAQIRLDQVGRLWVQDYEPADEAPKSNFSQGPDDSRRWSVFSPEGVWLWDVIVPAGLFVFDIGDTWILGLVRDELGVERVQLHDLVLTDG